MSKYIIQSEKLGNIGDVYEPTEGINIEALIAGGFISTATETKSPKVKSEPKE